MEITFKVKFNYTNFDSKLFQELNDIELEKIELKKFGHTEPTKIVYDKSNMKPFYDLWDKYLNVIIKGSNGFWLSASTSSTGVITCSGGIKSNSKTLNKVTDDLKKIFDIF
ncbi:hypothetical protein, partial [Chryseobacterium sp.]|uniref:hypothetical protein n=1 Tax=Chryseobacterium sp. TaxID=1871047 RepID=UPI00321A0C31